MEIQLWREILDPYRQAVDELTVKFEHMIEEHHNAGLYCPIVQVSGRVKKISSILEKCQRKNVPMEELEENGFSFRMETAAYFEDGRIKNVYLDGEYGGFAIHIMQK